MKTCILLVLSTLLVAVPASLIRSQAIKLKDLLPESRIVGGSLASPGQFPHQVFLSITLNSGGTTWCGGSIISAEWILTAAHCVYGSYKVEVFAGSLDIATLDPSAQIRTSSQIIIHSQYNHPRNLNNDISLIRLSTPLDFNFYVWPIALAGQNEVANSYEGQHVVTSGWGKIADAGPNPKELRFVDMYIENHQKCQSYYGPGTVTDGVICTNTEHGYRSTCNGDSGGPLVLKSNGRLIGITSFVSMSGCQSGVPDGFTKVAYYLDWIKLYSGVSP